MTKHETEVYRKRLLDLAAHLQGDIVGLTDEALRTTGGEAGGNLSNTPLHLADLGTDSHEQEVSAGLLENDRSVLASIHTALQCLEDGSYGICEQCNKAIPPGRLKTVPYATRCVDCARDTEQAQV